MGLIPPERDEPEILPFMSSSPPGERVLVLAPHPDDETLGCGGTLKRLCTMGKEVMVVFLTEGEKADPEARGKKRYAETRRREATKAMRVLGVRAYEFLGFPDRELFHHREKFEKALRRIISEFGPDAAYCPSLIEINPDHRAAAELLLTFRGESPDLRCVFYEITSPIRPNILIDVTDTYRYKEKAVKCYKSQLRITDYLVLIRALNTYRSFTLGRGVKYAEALWEVGEEASRDGMGLWLGYERALS
jgi:LmbE family N-acetylglucosaminyl deacetylase